MCVEDDVPGAAGTLEQVFHLGCAHHAKPNTDSTRSRTPIPRQAEPPFHSKPNTDSTRSRTLSGLDVEPLSGT
jgi:hypothetical protein